ncbi:hypothetical protein BDR03DRAFT_976381, partial [Suillus americanus]
MKPRANQGVIDARLNVYGVTNLKVADMSIAPKNVGTVGSGRGSLTHSLTVSLEYIFDSASHWREGCD